MALGCVGAVIDVSPAARITPRAANWPEVGCIYLRPLSPMCVAQAFLSASSLVANNRKGGR